jgi:large subunit ribosomal protein L29
MNTKEIRGMNEGDRQKKLVELLREQFNLRMNKVTGQLGAPHRIKEVRRDIARIHTVMNEPKGSAV